MNLPIPGRNTGLLLTVFVIMAALIPEPAFGYGGPGSVISGVGALLAAIAAIGAAIFGFLWFPMKRLVQKMRGNGGEGRDIAD